MSQERPRVLSPRWNLGIALTGLALQVAGLLGAAGGGQALADPEPGALEAMLQWLAAPKISYPLLLIGAAMMAGVAGAYLPGKRLFRPKRRRWLDQSLSQFLRLLRDKTTVTTLDAKRMTAAAQGKWALVDATVTDVRDDDEIEVVLREEHRTSEIQIIAADVDRPVPGSGDVVRLCGRLHFQGRWTVRLHHCEVLGRPDEEFARGWNELDREDRPEDLPS